jgi:hypothetical protein
MTKELLILLILVLVSIPNNIVSLSLDFVLRSSQDGESSILRAQTEGQSRTTQDSELVELSNYAFAQQVDTAWIRRYTGPGNSRDWARAIAVDGSGNVYVTGESYDSVTFDDYATVKYYSNGDTAWVRRYNGPANAGDRSYAIAVDGSCNIYVTGESYGGETGYDYTTIKYYPNGDTAWLRRYNGPGNENDAARAIAVDHSGYVYVTGWSYGIGTHSDWATIKYHPDGDTAWVRRYNGPENGSDYPSAIAIDGSGHIYVTGYTEGSSLYDYDYVTIKYYPNGDTAWVRRYNGLGSGSDCAYAITVDDSGNAYVAGESVGSGIEADFLTIKYYAIGETAWVRRYDGPVHLWDGAYAIAVDDSGNVCVTGGSFGTLIDGDYVTIRYHPNGDTAWVRRYKGVPSGGDCAYDIAVDGSGNTYVTGLSSNGKDLDYTTIKYSPNGDTAWVKRYNGPGDSTDYGNAMALDESDNVYVTGTSADTGSYPNYYDFATIKYVQFLCGDGNNDGVVGIDDVVCLINYLFIGGPAPDPIQAGDVNLDGVANIADVIYLVNYLFTSGPAPCS